MQWLLLVEDDEAAAALITARLADSPWRIERAVTLGQTYARLENVGDEGPAAILLDLNLPDSEGFSTVSALIGMVPHLPIVVITGILNDELRLQVVESGAQEFVLKSHLDDLELLVSTAIARQRHRNHALAMAVTAGMRSQGSAETPSSLLDTNPLLRRSANAVASLRESLPQVFDQFAARYRTILDRSIEAASYRGHERPVADIKQMARDLGVINCAPRDVVDIHLGVLEDLAQVVHPERVIAMAEEGRVVAMELMGYLALHYRDHAPFRFGSVGTT